MRLSHQLNMTQCKEASAASLLNEACSATISKHGAQAAASFVAGAAKSLTAEYNLEARSRQFLKQYPGLRGQYSLELVHYTPYLIAEEKEEICADYAAVFRALNWAQFACSGRLETIVPNSKSPFKDRVTFCWYAYSPYSQQGSRMRTLYQNVLFRDSSTWYMTNKQAMLRRLLLFEAARKAAVDAGLAAAGVCDVSCDAFIPATQIYSHGREATVASAMVSGQTFIVKPATGLQGRGILLYRCPQPHAATSAKADFGSFMASQYGEANIRSSFYVVQRYVERPLLIQGRKFDLRVYLLIVPNMSCCVGCDSNANRRGFYAFYHPGFARLSSLDYGDGSSRDMRVHLTNCCVQEEGPVSCLDGTNWTPDQVNDYFNARFDGGLDGIPCHDWFRTTAQADMRGILAYVVSQFSRMLAAGAYNAFKLLGCDFLVDTGAAAWLLEMNSLPSLRVRSPCQRAVKGPMQREALALAIEVAHRSANALPVTSRCLAMRQNFRLIYSPTNPGVQRGLVRAFNERRQARS